MKRYLLLLVLIALSACGGGGNSGGSHLPPPTNVSVEGSENGQIGVPNTITLTANPAALVIKGSSSITATVKDISGGNVPDGTKVRFTVNDASLGTITAQATTFNGNAIATFTAGSKPGTVIVTAASGKITQTISIPIAAAAAASIEFISATPPVIGIKGTGQPEVSNVVFAVQDVTGGPIVDGTAIDFTMNGPSGGKLPADGGEYIGDVIDSTPTQASGSTSGGQVTIALHSGKVAGPVTIIATVSGTSISTSTSTISIGGGLPSAKHFNLATSTFNLPGLAISGLTATETAFIADRFGNFNLLTGTSVSFYTEAGAIGRSGLTDPTGTTTSTIRTQAPIPVDVRPAPTEPFYTANGHTFNPRDGWLTVLATVQGEEAFNDLNGNGIYDLGEPFTDLGEPFIDKNDDGCRNSGTEKNCNGVISASTEPFEEYIDANGNGQYDGPNGVWDGPNCPAAGCQTSKMIWTSIKLQFTDTQPVFYSTAFVPSGTFAVAPTSITKGSSGAFSVIYGDYNLNILEAGTTIAATASVGTLTVTQVESPLGDRVSSGPSMFSFIVAIDAGTAADVNSSIVTATVTTPRGIKSTIATTVNLAPAPAAPITFTGPPTLPVGKAGTAYTASITVTGGTPFAGGVYAFNVTGGSLPPGLSLATSGATGAITGTPTTAGTYSFTVKATDSKGATASQVFSITISSSPIIFTGPATLPVGTFTPVPVAYNASIPVTGGVPFAGGVYSFAVTGVNPLPPGLSLAGSGTTGNITGTPTAAGPYSFTVTVTDSLSTSVSKVFSITIN